MKFALQIENLVKTYAGGVTALKGISLNVEKGDFFALLGPNGAGKSTTIGILSSLVNKTSGKIQIFDANIDTNLAKAKAYIGVVPQEFNFNVFERVDQIVINQGGYYGMDRKIATESALKYLQQLGLYEKRKESAGKLSGGMKRRLMIARALIHSPKILILDEPTAGVDIELRRSLWEFLQKLNASGITVILTTHYLEEAENLCRNIAIIDEGKIVENTSMKDLLQKLDHETFILDFTGRLNSFKTIEGIDIKQTDSSTLEASIYGDASLNDLFKLLEQNGIKISSMRNKSNRLEELFLKLVEKKS
ncbi:MULTISPECIES: ABC transporter ATP-binding protein [Leptospira]|uniref:ABC transporter, ATP-binding protein YadG n=5 Tax=Leptospira borgpetersenii TaxID=174 RepID=M3GD29_LEPBO|nr:MULTISPECIES: ABC transporter ATP-binding protein [Leptospira]EMF98831.1 ABC transporter, ATP-binding protein YadG [Leptospira borgpetersenii str. 200701203]EMO08290.1 ABC transporter, ATP-binding protein YadG [Leptospira borgpetersenii str. Noumea 25]ALO25486.1 ABC transporter, ATP-binding protein YadG [Leptospira borgpetersenii serovar Ballum]ANH00390.1 ABC transporter, ATP-binding protein YadG [Leptospira borgpetersenii str. 4E]AXX15818.1 ABC transporter ATP-binding protein [Leptospira b